MSTVLFDGYKEVSDQEAIVRMKSYANRAEELMMLHKEDKKKCLQLAKELRKELAEEYRVGNLIRIEKIYIDNKFFSANYMPAITDAYVKTTGVLGYKNLFSFLYDVSDYMNYHLPQEK